MPRARNNLFYGFMAVSGLMNVLATSGILYFSMWYIRRETGITLPQVPSIFTYLLAYFFDGLFVAIAKLACGFEVGNTLGYVKDLCDYGLLILCVVVGAIITPTKENLREIVILVLAVGLWAISVAFLVNRNSFYGLLDLLITPLQTLLLFYAKAAFQSEAHLASSVEGLVAVAVVLLFLISLRNYVDEKSTGVARSKSLIGLLVDYFLPWVFRRTGFDHLAQGNVFRDHLLPWINNKLGFKDNEEEAPGVAGPNLPLPHAD